MMKQHSTFSIQHSAYLLCLLAVSVSGAVTEQDLYRVFEERSIEFDADSVREGIVGGILRALDPRARVLSADEAELLANAPTIEKSETWNDDICYMKLNGLYESGGDEVARQIREWSQLGEPGLVVDLRDAGGNDLRSVARIAELFATGDTLLYEVRDGGGRVVDSIRTPPTPALHITTPLMLLVDDSTRGASEVLAGVLQGRGGVVLIGSRTKGHDGLMEAIPLSDTESLYMATRWVSLDRECLSISNGVSPDIAVTEEADVNTGLAMSGKELVGKPLSAKAKLDRDLMERVVGDAALNRATDILLGLKALDTGRPMRLSVTNEGGNADR